MCEPYFYYSTIDASMSCYQAMHYGLFIKHAPVISILIQVDRLQAAHDQETRLQYV